MVHKRLLSIGILAVSALGLSACVDQYAYGRAPGYYDDGGYYSQYDQYYGDPYGFRYLPVGVVGLGFGWYNNFYYPGVGGYVYDRRGVRRGWNQQQRAYWQPRVAHRQNYRRDNAGISNRIGNGIAQQQQLNRQRAQYDRRGNRADQRQVQGGRQVQAERRGQVERQVQAERRGNRTDQRWNQAQRQGEQNSRQQARAERPSRAERPTQAERQARPSRSATAQPPVRTERRTQRDMRQQYQRQQQSYRNGGDRSGRQQSRQRY